MVMAMMLVKTEGISSVAIIRPNGYVAAYVELCVVLICPAVRPKQVNEYRSNKCEWDEAVSSATMVSAA